MTSPRRTEALCVECLALGVHVPKTLPPPHPQRHPHVGGNWAAHRLWLLELGPQRHVPGCMVGGTTGMGTGHGGALGGRMACRKPLPM